MAKKATAIDYLLERAIQAMEGSRPEDLEAYLLSLSHEKLVDLFVQLLKSYRLAARVANAAWKFLGVLQTGEPEDDAYQALLGALSKYSPANFSPDASVREVLQDLYDRAHFEATKEGVIELIYARAKEGGA